MTPVDRPFPYSVKCGRRIMSMTAIRLNLYLDMKAAELAFNIIDSCKIPTFNIIQENDRLT